jgi:hypothetical protein
MDDALKRLFGVDSDGHGAADAAGLHRRLERVAESGVGVVVELT